MEKRTLVLNASSGISGDMMVGALLDLGADQKVLLTAMESLHLEGARVRISRVKKSALDACDFDVILDEEHENHDHDMAYLHPADNGYRHGDHVHKSHSHEDHFHEERHVGHHEDPKEDHVHEGHHHHGRNLADIEAILRSGNLTQPALELALKIFRVVAQAESKVHGEPIEQVHFHEVGAVDSIIDIAAVAVCMDNLGITDVIVTDLSEGTGTVMCQHGLLPVPVPATAQILSTYQIPFGVLSYVKGELITPTGAAILAALEAESRLPERFRILKMGLGAGKRDYAVSGVLRAMLIGPDKAEEKNKMIKPDDSSGRDEIIKLETNIDDSTGEGLGAVMDILLKEGARDVYYVPAYMKKNRPAYVLNVLCSEEDRARLEKVIFRNTTTIGIREIHCSRAVLPRQVLTVETPWGMADVKVCRIGNDQVIYPEADSVTRLGKENGIGYLEMYHQVKEYVKKQL